MAFIKTNADYAKCGFLIYTCWATKPTNGSSSIAGSLLLDGALSEEEALSLVKPHLEEDYLQYCIPLYLY